MGKGLWFLIRTLIVVAGLFALAAGTLRWRYGGGELYFDLAATPSLLLSAAGGRPVLVKGPNLPGH